MWLPAEQHGAHHAGAAGSAVACSPRTSPKLLEAAAAETSAEPTRFSQSSMGYVKKASVEKGLDWGPQAAW